ncbi:MAG: sigma-70 family RNA polymerase sigma factor [Nitrospinae bacterium]|nr:sigma-70 family RNA polymerase sigma factor [Nitrospinota bacterium]
MDSEAHLLERLKAGDEAAFADFMELYQQRIYYLALRWMPDPESARDITQQTFLRAHQAIGRFRGQASLHTWLYRIALNLCKNHLRDADRARQKLESYAEARSLKQAEEAANTSAEEFDALRGVIDRLHTRQRETLLLRVVEDLSFNEIAEVMQCSEGTAKSNYHHAVKNLRSMVLAEEGQFL